MQFYGRGVDMANMESMILSLNLFFKKKEISKHVNEESCSAPCGIGLLVLDQRSLRNPNSSIKGGLLRLL